MRKMLLADLKLLRRVCAKLRLTRIHVVEGADHEFSVLRRSGRTDDEVAEAVMHEASRFLK